MTSLFFHQGWYLPNENDALVQEVTTAGYQIQQRQAIMDLLIKRHCEFEHCLDIGAHVGLWSKPLLDHFEKITAFEPMPVLHQCFEKNVPLDRVTLHKVALGATQGKIKINLDHTDTGGTHISPDGNTEVEMDMLDNFDLGKVDYIKMDVEGYESQVLKGATKLLAEQSPVIHLELKMASLKRWNLDKDSVRAWLADKGYQQALKIKSEFVFCKD
jgi:FkbM family methyltransferase